MVATSLVSEATLVCAHRAAIADGRQSHKQGARRCQSRSVVPGARPRRAEPHAPRAVAVVEAANARGKQGRTATELEGGMQLHSEQV
eukprot:scaffold9555_cov123-Isochrysis_galbana.AAC.3